MTSQIVATAVEYDLPAIWVILNNYELGIERKGMERSYSRSHPWCHFVRKDTGKPYNPDYVALAHAYGAEGVRIDDPAALAPALERAFASRRPWVIDVPIDLSVGSYFTKGIDRAYPDKWAKSYPSYNLLRNVGRLGLRAKEVYHGDPKAEAKPQRTAASSGDVIEELRRRYDRLTQSQKRIAEYIVEHSQAVAFSTVDQMAAQLDVNPSTIVRFTYRLGLNGFPDLQERMRELVRGQLSRTGDPINERQVAAHLDGTSFGASLSHDWQNLHRTISGLDAAAFGRAINILSRARRVYVVAGFSTFPVAHYFALVLDRLRSDISLLASNDAFATPRLVEIKPEDCVVAFTFPRYASATHRVALWAKENKAKVIAVTDSPISAVGQIGDVVLLAASAGTGMQNSHGGADGRRQCAAQRRRGGQGNARARALQPPRPVDEPLGRLPAEIGWGRLMVEAPAAAAALTGIRVLDLTTNYAAYAGRLLADLGADVVRVEPPEGSPVRSLAPCQPGPAGEAFSFAHAFLDAGKRSVTLDLATAAGRELLAELAATSDVMIETPSATAGERHRLRIASASAIPASSWCRSRRSASTDLMPDMQRPI